MISPPFYDFRGRFWFVFSFYFLWLVLEEAFVSLGYLVMKLRLMVMIFTRRLLCRFR